MDEIILSHENTLPLQEIKQSLSFEAQSVLEGIRLSIDATINKIYGQIDFQSFIKLVDSIFDTYPTRFINGKLEDAGGKYLGSLKILTIALMLGLSTTQALRLFGEHYQSVQNNPEGDDHQNIRNLDEFGIEGVKIYGVPFQVK